MASHTHDKALWFVKARQGARRGRRRASQRSATTASVVEGHQKILIFGALAYACLAHSLLLFVLWCCVQLGLDTSNTQEDKCELEGARAKIEPGKKTGTNKETSA